MSKEPALITVDIHEANSNIFEAIQERNIGEVYQKHMDSGDVVIYHPESSKSVSIEIKRGTDYLNSLQSGRLQNQICIMADHYDFNVLIVEGGRVHVTDDDTEETVNEKHRKFKMSLRTLNRRITVCETSNQSETIDIIEEIVRDMEAHKLFVIRRPILIEESESPSVRVLCAFPQVSRERATLLLEKYDNARNALFHLSEWPDMNIGLTQERCDRIREAWED